MEVACLCFLLFLAFFFFLFFFSSSLSARFESCTCRTVQTLV